MSNNTTQAAPTATKAESTPAAAAAAKDDGECTRPHCRFRAPLTAILFAAKSVMSDTSTLAEDNKTGSSSPKGGKGKTSSPSKDGQLDSASAFAKEAAKKGWAAPTATRPTFG